MKWGQGNQRFATMRLRGEKDEENVITIKKIENVINVKIIKISKYHNLMKYCKIRFFKIYYFIK